MAKLALKIPAIAAVSPMVHKVCTLAISNMDVRRRNRNNREDGAGDLSCSRYDNTLTTHAAKAESATAGMEAFVLTVLKVQYAARMAT